MEFGLLGPVRVHDGQRICPIPAAKQRVVLAALLLRDGAIVGVDELVELVWNGRPPDGAQIALRNHVMRLRRALGPGAAARVRTRAPGYLIDVHDGEFDLRTATQLIERGIAAERAGSWVRARADLGRALDLWRGEPLLDVPSEPLASRESGRLAELRLDALRRRIDADLRLGEHERVVTELAELVREYPLREGFHAQLMLSLYRAGRQSEALAAFQRARRTLVEEVGVEPGHELAELHRRMLTLDPTLRAPERIAASGAPPASAAPAAAPTPPNGPPPGPAPPNRQLPGTPSPNGQLPGTPSPNGPLPRRVAGVRRGLPVPAQLPADLADFTGRAAAVELLHRMLREAAGASGAVAVLTGPAGIGKTTLAIRVAHLLREQFPDGQLYVNLRGATDTPQTADAVAARLLRDLGVDPRRIPADEDERDNLYRSALAGRRVLLVLDDARDPAQVRRLIPGSPGGAALITSRNRLSTLATSCRVELDTLEPAESAELIGRVVGTRRTGAEPDATAEVLNACAGLPLAIRITAARLVARPTQTIRSFADRLNDVRARLDQLSADDLEVRATFAMSYARLPGPARTAFRLLGLWSGADIGRGAAGALLGESEPAAERVLDTLVDAYLLQNPAPDRYRLHDLMHVYARERAERDSPRADRHEAVRRLLTWYLNTVINAAPHLRPHRTPEPLDAAGARVRPLAFADYQSALAWLDSEQGNFVAATRTAAAFGLHEHAWRLAAALWSYYYVGKRTEDWLAASDIGLRSARLLGDKRSEGAMLADYATALCESRRYDEAIERYRRALTLHEASGDVARQPATLNSLAVAYAETDRYGPAIDAFGRARVLNAGLGNRLGEAMALANMALCHAELGQPDEAVRYNREALAMYRAVGDRYAEAICLANLGETHAQTGAHDVAVRLFAEAVAMHTETGNDHGRARTLLALGRSQAATGSLAAARESWREAHDIFARLGRPEAEEAAELLAHQG